MDIEAARATVERYKALQRTFLDEAAPPGSVDRISKVMKALDRWHAVMRGERYKQFYSDVLAADTFLKMNGRIAEVSADEAHVERIMLHGYTDPAVDVDGGQS